MGLHRPGQGHTIAGKRIRHETADKIGTRLLADNDLNGTYRRVALPGQSWRRAQTDSGQSDVPNAHATKRACAQNPVTVTRPIFVNLEIHGLGRRAPCRVDVCQGASPLHLAPVLFEVGKRCSSVPVEKDCECVRAPTGAARRATRGHREQGSSIRNGASCCWPSGYIQVGPESHLTKTLHQLPRTKEGVSCCHSSNSAAP